MVKFEVNRSCEILHQQFLHFSKTYFTMFCRNDAGLNLFHRMGIRTIGDLASINTIAAKSIPAGDNRLQRLRKALKVLPYDSSAPDTWNVGLETVCFSVWCQNFTKISHFFKNYWFFFGRGGLEVTIYTFFFFFAGLWWLSFILVRIKRLVFFYFTIYFRTPKNV